MSFLRYSRALLEVAPAKAAKVAKVQRGQTVSAAKAGPGDAKVPAANPNFSIALAELSQPKPAEKLGFSRFSSFSGGGAFEPADSAIPDHWRLGVDRLLGMPAPASYPAHAWRCLQDDAPTFLERWAAQAIRLGWQDWHLWGVHRRAPWRRLDAMGLVLMLRGKRVVALVEDAAVIETRTGSRQSFARRLADPLAPVERCLIWELE